MSIWTIIGIAVAFYAGMFLAGLMANRRIHEADALAEFWHDKYAALVETVAARTDQAKGTETDGGPSMNALTRDRQVGDKLSPTGYKLSPVEAWVLALAFLLLIVALFAVIIHNDARIQRWQRQIQELETERDEARAELRMWQGALRGLAEGTATETKED